MGALLAFPAVYRDYTAQFTEKKQQPIKTLSRRMREMVERHERLWDRQLQKNVKMLWESVNPMDEVVPGVWIGTADAARNEELLEDNRISTILNMASECSYQNPSRNIRVVRIGIDDGCMTSVGVFEKAADILRDAVNAGDNVLVHCAAGVSRSCTAVISYLMLYKGWGLSECLEEIREHRPCANPHPQLVRSLIRDFGPRFIP